MYNSIFEGYNPYGEKFPSEVDNLLLDIKKDLKVNKLSFSEDEILKLTHIYDEEIDREVVKSEKTLSIVAYIGSFFISNHGGKWKMQRTESINGIVTWIPLIEYKGRDINYVKYVMEDLQESSEFFMVYEIYAVMKNRLNIKGTLPRE